MAIGANWAHRLLGGGCGGLPSLCGLKNFAAVIPQQAELVLEHDGGSTRFGIGFSYGV